MICTNVRSRYGTSSESWAEANQVKFIQPHHTAKKIVANPTTPWATSPAASWWCRADAARPTATTKVRSKNSSRGVEARCSSSRSRTTARPVRRCRTVVAMAGTYRTGVWGNMGP